MYLSDIHTHSIASGHGTICTISDMAKAASSKGLKLLGITDHGPATLAAGTSSYFRSLTYSPRKRFNVELLYGIELNILDVNGKVDLEQELLEKLDYAIASMHLQNFRPAGREENTQAFLNVMKNPVVKILGHIDNTQYELDYDAIIKAAGENGVIPEINEASLAPYGYRVIPGAIVPKFFAAAVNIWFRLFYPVIATVPHTLVTSSMPLTSSIRQCFLKA